MDDNQTNTGTQTPESTDEDNLPFDLIRKENDTLLVKMQTPEAKEAVKEPSINALAEEFGVELKPDLMWSEMQVCTACEGTGADPLSPANGCKYCYGAGKGLMNVRKPNV
jgi:DnaJ-class molecular chaperone